MLHFFGLILSIAVVLYAPWSWASSAPQVFFFGVCAGSVLCYFAFPYIFTLVGYATAPPLEIEEASTIGTGRGVLAPTPPERRIVISDPQKVQELWDAIGPVGMDNPPYRAYLAIQWAIRVGGIDPQQDAVGLDVSDARYVVLVVRRDPIPGA